MISRITFLLVICLVLQSSVLAKEKTMIQDSITVYVFLHESCLISQYYTLPLRQLNDEFANDKIQFVGIFPNLSSEINKIQAFKDKYKISFDLKTDYDKTRTEQFGATITPEVIIFDEAQNKILYKGRIDDAYARVGKRKQVTSTSELQDALVAISKNLPIEVTETEAVGCYISMQKPN